MLKISPAMNRDSFSSQDCIIRDESTSVFEESSHGERNMMFSMEELDKEGIVVANGFPLCSSPDLQQFDKVLFFNYNPILPYVNMFFLLSFVSGV